MAKKRSQDLHAAEFSTPEGADGAYSACSKRAAKQRRDRRGLGLKDLNPGMNAGQQYSRPLASLSAYHRVCKSCLRDARRRYASAAAAEVEKPTITSTDPSRTQASSPQKAYQIRAGVVLSRPPQITRDLTPFEKAYFLYQRRLNDRLALPFTRYHYFKKGTPADEEWKRKAKPRLTPARDIGVYSAYGKEGWNDEILVGAQESEPEHQMEALLKDAEVPGVGGGEGAEARQEPVERPMPRVTEADRTNDQKSLNRLLQRTLYLVVKNADGRWSFPSARVLKKETVHQAAERILVQAGGVNMNTWVVGNAPIGHYKFDFFPHLHNTEGDSEEIGEKTFFMKARIMAGQADMSQNKLGLSDFNWLAKEEVEASVSRLYWDSIRHMLACR